MNTLSGCDFDGDAVLITDNEILIRAAQRNVGKFRVAVCDIPSTKSRRCYTPQHQADLDIKTSNNLIGDIINLSQELNTIIWDKINNGATVDDVQDIYTDVCILNVMSGIEIDKAKKEVMVNNARELSVLRNEYKITDGERAVKPKFFGAKDRGKGYYDAKKKHYKPHKTSMDFVQQCVDGYRKQRPQQVMDKRAHMDRATAQLLNRPKRDTFLPFSSIVECEGYVWQHVNINKVNTILQDIDSTSYDIKRVCGDDTLSPRRRSEWASELRNQLIGRIGKMTLTRNTIIYLLKLIDDPEKARYARKILTILFAIPNVGFYSALKRSVEPVELCLPAASGTVKLFEKQVEFVKKRINTDEILQ